MGGQTSAENGKLGGRPKGSRQTNAQIHAARKLRPSVYELEKRKLSLAERCQLHEEEIITMFEEIVRDGKLPPSARIQAGMAILDRARGKPLQPSVVEAAVSWRISTGVPDRDDDSTGLPYTSSPVKYEAVLTGHPIPSAPRETYRAVMIEGSTTAEQYVPVSVPAARAEPAPLSPLEAEALLLKQSRDTDQERINSLEPVDWARG